MIADFNDAFPKKKENSVEIPDEVLSCLNKDLPSNFIYYKDKDGYRVGPKPEAISEKMLLNVNINKEFVDKHFKGISEDKWTEYIYRTQLPIPVSNVCIGDKAKQIPIENMQGNPLDDSNTTVKDAFIYPEPFPPAIPMHFETEDGDIIELHIRRAPYGSLSEVKFVNENFPAIKFSIIYDEKKGTSKVKCSIALAKAESSVDALSAVHFFKSFYNRTLKIEGQEIQNFVNFQKEINLDSLYAEQEFWTNAIQLEKKLNVSFKPGERISKEDIRLFAELATSLIKGKEIGWEHPIEHFRIVNLRMNGESLDELIGKEKLTIEFREGPELLELLGAKFEVYSKTKLVDIIITSIEWDDKNKKSAEIYVSDPPDGTWKLYRKYMTKEQALEADSIKSNDRNAEL